jgi:hypothetical protein
MMHYISKRLIFLVFFFFLLINIVSAGGHLDSWDGIEAFLVTESMVLKHTAKLDPAVPSVEKLNFEDDLRYTVFANTANTTLKAAYNETTIPLEPVYTVRSLLLSAIAVPFYYAAMILSIDPVVVIGILVNSLFIALTSVVIFCFLLEIHRSKKIAFILSVTFGVCSFVLPYHTSFWTQPLQALTLIASAFFIYRSLHDSSSFLCHYTSQRNSKDAINFAGLGGLFLGLSVFAHPTSVVLIPGFVAYSILSMRRNRKILVSFLVTLGITLFFAGLLNYVRFGSFAEFGYGYYGSLSAHDGWNGLVGLLISPGAGLFIYFPIALLLPWAAKYMYKENKGLLLLCTYVIVVSWLDVGTLSFGDEPFAWSGGGWGPRYLIPVLPFITIMLGNILTHLRKKIFMKVSVIALSIAGFYISLIATLVWWNYEYLYIFDIFQREQSPNTDPYNTMIWQPHYSPIVMVTNMLLSDYVSHIDLEIYFKTDWHFVTYGLAPCSYDIYFYCKFGIGPIMILLAIIGLLAILIIKRIGMLNKHNKIIKIITDFFIASKRI